MKKISLALILLFILTLCFAEKLTDLTVQINNKSIVFKSNELTKLNPAELSELKKNQKAYALSDLLNYLKISVKSNQSIEFKSVDNASQKISANDINKTWLVTEEKKDKKYYRLMIPSDPFHQRWIKYINTIIIK